MLHTRNNNDRQRMIDCDETKKEKKSIIFHVVARYPIRRINTFATILQLDTLEKRKKISLCKEKHTIYIRSSCICQT